MTTYTIDLSTVTRDRKGNNWRNALDICKRRLAGTYDAEEKVWTVETTPTDVRLASLAENYGATVVAR